MYKYISTKNACQNIEMPSNLTESLYYFLERN